MGADNTYGEEYFNPKQNRIESLTIEFTENKVTIKSEISFDSGWYLVCEGNIFELYSIPLYGGNHILERSFNNIVEAINYTKYLT